MALAEMINASKVSGVQNVQPAYCSITVLFQPELIEFASLSNLIFSLNNDLKKDKIGRGGNIIAVPVCYDDEYGLDLKELENELSLPKEKIISLHAAQEYQIYMVGFLPGFPYMGLLPEELNCSRKKIPRKLVPVGAVAIAGKQTGIYPIDSPGGWKIIGHTPLEIFNPEKKNPFLFKNGDRVKFKPVSKSEFLDLRNA